MAMAIIQVRVPLHVASRFAKFAAALAARVAKERPAAEKALRAAASKGDAKGVAEANGALRELADVEKRVTEGNLIRAVLEMAKLDEEEMLKWVTENGVTRGRPKGAEAAPPAVGNKGLKF